jgi:hypothetical protein
MYNSTVVVCRFCLYLLCDYLFVHYSSMLHVVAGLCDPQDMQQVAYNDTDAFRKIIQARVHCTTSSGFGGIGPDL